MTTQVGYNNIIRDHIQSLFRARKNFKPSGIACERLSEAFSEHQFRVAVNYQLYKYYKNEQKRVSISSLSLWFWKPCYSRQLEGGTRNEVVGGMKRSVSLKNQRVGRGMKFLLSRWAIKQVFFYSAIQSVRINRNSSSVFSWKWNDIQATYE